MGRCGVFRVGLDTHRVWKSMIERCDIKDLESIDDIMKHPKVYKTIVDDSCPERENFSIEAALKKKEVYVLKALVNNVLCGTFLFHPWNYATYEIHICILPEYWGKKVVELSKEAVQWMFSNTRCRKVVAFIPVFHRLAVTLAKKTGFKIEGVSEKSFQKEGVLYNQTLMGICKEVDLCQAQ